MYVVNKFLIGHVHSEQKQASILTVHVSQVQCPRYENATISFKSKYIVKVRHYLIYANYISWIIEDINAIY